MYISMCACVKAKSSRGTCLHFSAALFHTVYIQLCNLVIEGNQRVFLFFVFLPVSFHRFIEVSLQCLP